MIAQKRYHIVVDGINCEGNVLYREDIIRQLVTEIAGICKMNIVYGPILVQGIPQNPGVTCFAIIDYSHISIHTFTQTNEVCVDVFSCKPFEYQEVKLHVQKTFGIKNEDLKFLEINYD